VNPYSASVKLRDARIAMQRLRDLVTPHVVSNIMFVSGASGVKSDPIGTSDPVAFAEAFSSCVAQVRSVGDAVLKNKEARKMPGFSNWRELKKKECLNDELLRFLNQRRNDDLHEGFSPLSFVMHPFCFTTETVGAAPSPTAILFIDGTGPHWLVDQGTPHERRLSCGPLKGIAFTVAVANPPAMHLGKILPGTDPVMLLILAEAYYANLLFEARSKFAP